MSSPMKVAAVFNCICRFCVTTRDDNGFKRTSGATPTETEDASCQLKNINEKHFLRRLAVFEHEFVS
jgi:hypothetical protein